MIVTDSSTNSQEKKTAADFLRRAFHDYETKTRRRKARLAENAREASRRKKHKGPSKPWNMTDARIEDMLIVFRRRYGPLLPDDDCGRDDLELFAQHLAFRRGALVEHLAEFAALYAPWATAEEIAAICEFVGGNRRAFSAHELGQQLRLTQEERDALKHKVIRTHDATDESMKAARRAKDRAAKAEKRRKAGAKPHAMSAARLKPWKAEGMSKATWYRRRQKASETNSSAPKNTIADDETVSRQSAWSFVPLLHAVTRLSRGQGELRVPLAPASGG